MTSRNEQIECLNDQLIEKQAEIKRLRATVMLLRDVIGKIAQQNDVTVDDAAIDDLCDAALKSDTPLTDRVVVDRDEVEGLRRHVSDCQSRMYINCVYCGHRYGPKGSQAETVRDGLPMAEALRQHIEVCSEHPMSKLKAEVERLHTWKGLISLLDKHWPEDVFDGSSGDPGPSLVVALREIDRWRDTFQCDDPADAVSTSGVIQKEMGRRMQEIHQLRRKIKDLQEELAVAAEKLEMRSEKLDKVS